MPSTIIRKSARIRISVSRCPAYPSSHPGPYGALIQINALSARPREMAGVEDWLCRT